MQERTSIAGLPADGSTMVSGLPTAPAEEKPPPDWPLSVVMTAVAVLVAYVLVAAQWNQVDSVRGGANAAVTEVPRADGGGGDRAQGSYAEPANFRAALDQVGRRAGRNARVQVMRVDAGQVWVVLAVKGEQRVIRVTGGGITDDKGGQASGAEVRLEAIDPEAPQRMSRGLREKFGVAAEQIDYFALAGWSGEWNVFLKGGAFYHADPRGKKLVKAG